MAAKIGLVMAFSAMFAAAPAADASVPDWLNVSSHWGGLGLLAYVVIVVFPKISKEQRDERREQMDERKAREEALVKIIEGMNDRFNQRNSALAESIHRQTELLEGAINRQSEVVARLLPTVCRGPVRGQSHDP